MSRFSKLISYTEKHFFVPVTMFIFAIALIIAFVIVDYFIYGKQIEKLALENAVDKSLERYRLFQEEIEHAENVLFSIRENALFQSYLNTGELQYVLPLFYSITLSHEHIMQLRYIDANGKEKIRIDRKALGVQPFVVKKENLQNKSDRYYFSESINKPEKVWFSSLDLNIEHGKVENPFKPTYRAMLPLKKGAAFEGILIINIFAAPILEKMLSSPLYETMLADEEGYILVHSNRNKNWSRFQPTPFKLESVYQKALNGNIVSGEDFVARKLHLPFKNRLHLFLKLHPSYTKQQTEIYFNRMFLVVLMVFGISALFSVLIHFVLNTLHKDISVTHRQLEESQQQQKAQEVLLIQQSKMAEMGELIGAIAHQWKQPITTVHLLAEAILDREELGKLDSKTLHDFIQKIQQQTDYMNTTITDFRNYFKPSTEKTPFCVNDVILNMIKLVEHQFLREEIRIDVSQDETIRLLGYPNELMQVLLNLTKNARDAYSGGEQAEKIIAITMEKDSEWIQIRIKDHAGGIPEEIMDKIFMAHFTTKENEGTGIGLDISKKIIEDRFNGALTAKNHGDGAEFTISIPQTAQKQ